MKFHCPRCETSKLTRQGRRKWFCLVCGYIFKTEKAIVFVQPEENFLCQIVEKDRAKNLRR